MSAREGRPARTRAATSGLSWAALAVCFVISLAALVRMAGPAVDGPDVVTGIIRLPERVTTAIVALFALAVLVFLTHVMRRGLSRRQADDEEFERVAEVPPLPPWVRAVSRIASLLYFIVLAYLIWRGAIPLVEVVSLGGGGLLADSGAARVDPVSAPPLITWTFGILALAAGLGALALALWVAFGERLARWWDRPSSEAPADPLDDAVAESLDDLRTESDARRAIIRCYSRFERAAADSGVERKPWSTPMEFMRESLGRLPLPRAAVPALTGLFELARFSQRALGTTERDRALDALDEIKAALDDRRGDAPAH